MTDALTSLRSALDDRYLIERELGEGGEGETGGTLSEVSCVFPSPEAGEGTRCDNQGTLI
jgi:hypothetical protein